ncbi:unnamed protein product [Calypogeia fissa]
MGRKENPNKKQKEKRSESGEGGGVSSAGTMGAPIGDPRFSRLHTDPRFQRLPKNKAKVAIDSRFAHMFTEKGFSNPSVNKRGIKSKSSSGQIDPLRRYYRVDEEEAEGNELEGGDGDAEIVTEKKRGRKDRVKKKKKELNDKVNEQSDDSDASADELKASTSKTDISSKARKTRGKKDRIRKLRAQIAEVDVDSEGTWEEVEEVDEVEDGQDQRARVRTEALGSLESGEEFEDDDDDESGLEDGRYGNDDEDDREGSSSSSSSSDSESDVEQEISGAEEEEKVPTTEDETRRLAIVNMDWEHIRAVHLLVLMRSFAPKGGSVHSVTVYPSEFGVEQMKEENVHGPKSIFRKNDDEDDSDEEEADPEKLRQYEKAKLRYYYAVVDCDSASTAAHLYKNCDGLEFERTSNTLDLRFIPDAMEFKREPRDSASEVPVDYKPIEFETRALQHSNVKLTWDDDEPVRVKALRRNFNRDELDEMDFRAYVASSSESESEDQAEAEAAEVANGEDGDENIESTVGEDKKKEKVRSKYLALLAGTEEADTVRGKKSEKGNIEIKFHTGLDELSEKLLAKTKKDKGDETVWEAYLRRKKEKKNERKKKKSAADSDVSSDDEAMHSDGGGDHKDDPFFSHGNEDPFDDPFFNQDSEGERPAKTRNGREGKEGKMKDLNRSKKEEERKKKKEDAAREKKELEKKQAELELLLLDDHMVQNGEVEVPQASSLDDPGKTQKTDKKKRRGGKGKVEELQKKIASNANYDDPRFASLFTSHLYALDPTDPQYKKTGAHVAEMQRRHFQSSKIAQEHLDTNGDQDGEEGSNRKRKAEVSSLVRSLKSKVQAQALRTGRR